MSIVVEYRMVFFRRFANLGRDILGVADPTIGSFMRDEAPRQKHAAISRSNIDAKQ